MLVKPLASPDTEKLGLINTLQPNTRNPLTVSELTSYQDMLTNEEIPNGFVIVAETGYVGV